MRSTLLAALVPSIALGSVLLAACGPRAPEHSIVAAEGGAVRLPLAAVADGAVHFFTFRHDGRNVNFLVRTDGAGRLHAHLDACYTCYTYPVADEVWDFQGACAPIPIRFSVEEGRMIVERAVLERAARYF